MMYGCAHNQTPIMGTDGKGSVESQRRPCKRDFITRMLIVTTPNTALSNESEKK